MNYIYDIILNFNEEIYKFYDWNQNDLYTHIRKIPIYKISPEDLLLVKKNYIKFDNEFIEQIKNKTEIFITKGIKKINCCLLTDGLESLAISINDNKVKYSCLMLDEEIECLEISNNMSETKIPFRVIKKRAVEYKTRKEKEISKYIKTQIDKIYKENNIDKINYLYYECYDEKNIKKFDNRNIFNRKFKNEKKIYDILKLMQNNK